MCRLAVRGRPGLEAGTRDGLIPTVRESLERHVRTWADRYVEMRVEARTDGRT
ncbi:hypothetical protein [Natrinema pellirubrum]|uniref:hypothetical protein n=1 Tax=Natrinema pellirubrum TaxID=69525 RepID=UPI0014616B8D|nr:hypothetical protein [Natrinema pellirubrum]